MRLRRSKWAIWAAWLGISALGLNALVPIHLAFDLAAALQASDHARVESAGDDLDSPLLALIWQHHHGAEDGDDDHGGKPADDPCPVCAAVGTLIGFGLPIGLPQAVVVVATHVIDVVTLAGPVDDAAAAAYRARAPPLA